MRMALFPQPLRMRSGPARDGLLLQWPALAIAVVMAALFGFLSGAVRDVGFSSGVVAADQSPETPHLVKREPLRALASAERKDGNGTHWGGHDGMLVPRSVVLDPPIYSVAVALHISSGPETLPYWPGSLPRAPPASV